jgi:arsenate reductase-like glutaredoxin family protein
MIIYGLDTCPACNRARKDLEDAGHIVSIRDVRSEPLSEAELTEFVNEFAGRIVDTSTNDYRALSDWLKNSEVEDQIAAKPKVMTRPVIRAGDALHLGWGDDVKAVLL